MKVLVTGGAGYIGSHVVIELLEAGHEVVVLDNLSTGVRENVAPKARLILGEVGDAALLDRLLAAQGIEAVMHFAGSIIVPESVADPLKYYDNNTVCSRTLIAAVVRAGIEAFIFSSTAAVYGVPEVIPVTETTPTAPINPYGRSKLMTEWMLEDVSAASSLRYVALRYFNVSGADPSGRTGQSTPEATHLIKVATQTALGAREQMTIFGTDYDTPDGTCLRDYIHVSDLARAHVLALNYLEGGGASLVLNCGYGHGFSVREVIAAVEHAFGAPFSVFEGERRPGDPPALTANSDRLRAVLGWKPKHDDLRTIVGSALAWERRLTLDT